MRITKIESFRVRLPLRPERVMYTALGTHEVSDYVLVRVETDTGLVGAGEATVMPTWSGETAAGAKALLDEILAPRILGMDPCDHGAIDARLDRCCRHNWFTKAAIEMACWDLDGRAQGRPVYELLGGAQRPLTVRSRFSMGAYTPEVASRRAHELVAAGFTTIKVKVGGEPDADVARVRAVREAIGPEMPIVVDANCGWTPDVAIDCLRRLADCNLALIEQPTPDGDYEGLARVRREIPVPVMADDICFDMSHAKLLLRHECCDVISIYPGKNGGIAKSRAIARLAAEHGVACSIGSNLELDVATAAMAHLVVAESNMRVETYPGDMLGPSYHAGSIALKPIQIEGPLTTCPDGPGLGVEVDWDRVRAGSS